jgi:uncharacterized membrane protein YgcG
MKSTLSFKKLLIVFLVFVTCLFMTCPLNARNLYWDRVEVRAHLNADGSLSVTEFQTYIFNGEWNGGERWFDVHAGQQFKWLGMERFERGRVYALRPGNLNRVDEYKWTESHRLRWRSRLPTDPPFNQTSIQYVLRYQYNNVLRKIGSQYILDHNFLFSDRSGVIQNYSLYFSADPVWKIAYTLPLQYFEKSIQPGLGYVLNLQLVYQGSNLPNALTPLDRNTRLGLWVLFYVCMLCFLIPFYIKEKSKGRFVPIPSFQKMDEKVLIKRLLSLLPEEVGALWDENIGSPEVTAILARMVQENKIKSTLISASNMQFELLVSKNTLTGYEKKLIDGLFFGGRKQVSTQALKTYYRKAGFDPASLISAGLNASIVQHTDLRNIQKTYSDYRLAWRLIGVGILIAAVNILFHGFSYAQWVFPLGLLALLSFFGSALFLYWLFRKEIAKTGSILFKVWFCASIPLGVTLIQLDTYQDPLFFGPYLGLMFFVLGLSWALMVMGQTEDPMKKMALRRELICIRNYLKDQLKQKNPKLKDEWLPYLLAFGLSSSVDRWTRVFADQVATGGTLSNRVSGGSFSSASTKSSWSGGGGQFGGAGAVGSWVSATAVMASGVTAASSSSGGGGGSSGGGGGGGW